MLLLQIGIICLCQLCILQMEVVTVCWDAIDGSTLYQLIETAGISSNYQLASKVLMAFWYTCVGFRMAIMLLTHLDPSARVYGAVLMYPLQLAPQPTVDRSLQGIRLRYYFLVFVATMRIFGANFLTFFLQRTYYNGHEYR